MKLARFLPLLLLILGCSSPSDPDAPGGPSVEVEDGSRATQCVPLSLKYNRDSLFGYWIDEDKDCQNTRAEILIARSARPVTFTTTSKCTVDSGEWIDPYTGNVHYTASELQIDHIVPLADAWRSGAWSWSKQERVAFANDTMHLVAVESAVNLQKSDQGPEDWMPPNSNVWAFYATQWIRSKNRYGLSARPSEAKFLLLFGDFRLVRECSI